MGFHRMLQCSSVMNACLVLNLPEVTVQQHHSLCPLGWLFCPLHLGTGVAKATHVAAASYLGVLLTQYVPHFHLTASPQRIAPAAAAQQQGAS